ncbi:MAG: helix-turn-helix domain-containing protein [Acidimicrobiales bacterium]
MVRTDQSVISAYEHGRRSPSAEMLNRIVVACGYRLAALDAAGGTFTAPIPKVGWFSDEHFIQAAGTRMDRTWR